VRRGFIGRSAKVDANQRAIMEELKKFVDISCVAIGKPLDLLIGYDGENFLIEIKNPDGKDRRGPSWESQLAFMGQWRGSSHVCSSFEEVLAAIHYRRDD
jgi:hypothetical protein